MHRLFLSVCCLAFAFTLNAQIYQAENGLTVKGNGQNRRVVWGGTLLNAQTVIDFGSSNSSSNLLLKKGIDNYFFIANNGNIGINTTAPSERLEVNGVIKSAGLLIAADAGAGKILTSDGLGFASWQTPIDLSNLNANYWRQGGNSFGVGNFGTIDNNDINFLRNGAQVFSFKRLDALRPVILKFPLTNVYGNSPVMTSNAFEISAGTYNGNPTAEMIIDSSSFNLLTFNLFGTKDHLLQMTPYTNLRSNAYAVFENYGYDKGLLINSSYTFGQGRPILFYTSRVYRAQFNAVGELQLNDQIDQGDYTLQNKGGFYNDVTGKQMRVVGLNTDNALSKLLASDSTGNLSWRDVSTIGGSGSSQWATAGANIYNSNAGLVTIGGSTNPNFSDANLKLAVNGSIYSKKVKVTQTGWPDYVFHPTYKLPSLNEIELFIQKNRHLPDVPSVAEVEANGLDLGDSQTILLKKIEELTLHLIEINKKVDRLANENEKLKRQLKRSE